MGSIMTRKKFVSLVAAMVATLALTLAFAPAAFAAPTPAANPYSEYQITTTPDNTGNNEEVGEYNQNIDITVKYDAPVVITDVNALRNSLTIKIAGRDVPSASYNRPVTFEASGNNLIIKIGTAVNESGDATFTAQYSGVLEITGTPAGMTIGGVAPTSAQAIDIYTVSPTGTKVTTSGEGTNAVTATFTHRANVRGMVHIYICKENSAGKLVPIATTAGTIGVYTFTTHAHAFYSMALSAYASNVNGLTLPSGYSTTLSGDSVTVTSANANDKLYFYIFDDDFLQYYGLEFSGMNTGTGEWGPGGNPDA